MRVPKTKHLRYFSLHSRNVVNHRIGMNLEDYMVLNVVDWHLHVFERILKMGVPGSGTVAGAIGIHHQIPDGIVAACRTHCVHEALGICIDGLVCLSCSLWIITYIHGSIAP